MKREELISNNIIERFNIDSDTLKALDRLAEYNLSFLTDNFTDKDLRTFSPEQLFPLIKHFGYFDINLSKRLELEFRRFIVITLLRQQRRSAPSGPVDMYWHFFVLHTESYVKFCNTIWGDYGSQPRKGKHYFQTTEDKFGTEENPKRKEIFVEHEPATDITRPEMLSAYKETRKIYAEVFGEPDNKFWPANDEHTCGDSYSGFIPKIFQSERQL